MQGKKKKKKKKKSIDEKNVIQDQVAICYFHKPNN